MKTRKLLPLFILPALVIGRNTEGAFIATGQDPTSLFYSDFTANSLNVNYSYDSVSGIGTFHAGNPYSASSLVPKVESYKSGVSSPGTAGAYANASFNGNYSIDATMKQVSGVWTLTSGTFAVRGDLFHTPNELLLQGNLTTGAGGTAFGYADPGLGNASAFYDQFQFLFTVTGGNSAIVADYLGMNNGHGGILLNAKFDHTNPYSYNNGFQTTSSDLTSIGTYKGFDGNWNRSFANPTAQGFADSFVPEPGFYPAAASLTALLGLMAGVRRVRFSNI